jgi:hypothetical protein
VGFAGGRSLFSKQIADEVQHLAVELRDAARPAEGGVAEKGNQG